MDWKFEMESSKVHFKDDFGYAACGLHWGRVNGIQLTAVPTKVTCMKCKRSPDFREMERPA